MGPGHPRSELSIIMAPIVFSRPFRAWVVTWVPGHVLDGPARTRPCQRPLTRSFYSFSARYRLASGPKPRSATARPLLGQFLAPAPRSLLLPVPDYVLGPRKCRSCPCAVVLGPVAPHSASMAAPVFDGFTRRAFLLPRACARAARVFNDVKALPAGFLEVVGICFYVPWLLRTTTTKMSIIVKIMARRIGSQLPLNCSRSFDADAYFGSRGLIAAPGRRHCASYSARFV